MTQAYPLHWPAHRPRNRYPERSKFKTTFDRARRDLRAELDRMGATDVILSTNVQLRLDGHPYADRRAPEDRGVAVYFKYNGQNMCFACDRWDSVQDNILAIHHTIEALRGIARWGSGDMLEAAFTGFQALPPPSSAVRTNETWWGVLKCSRLWDIATIEKHYREMARLHHPDSPNGSAEKMAELNTAIAQARKEKSGQES